MREQRGFSLARGGGDAHRACAIYEFFRHWKNWPNCYKIMILEPRRSGGMVDAADSKSAALYVCGGSSPFSGKILVFNISFFEIGVLPVFRENL